MGFFDNDYMDTDLVIQGTAGTGFKFSAVGLNNLGATEYTLVGVACDKSGSVSGFYKDLNVCLDSIVEACKKSPRAENLLIRGIEFNHFLTEIFGFRLLNTIQPKDLNISGVGGGTALYDAAYSIIGSVAEFGRTLVGNDYNANGIVFVITDGENMSSTATPKMIADLKREIVQNEDANLESILTILIGVNISNPSMKKRLDEFAKEAEFDQFIAIDDAGAASLAKIGQFVSKSVTSQTQSIGTGGPSQTITI